MFVSFDYIALKSTKMNLYITPSSFHHTLNDHT